MSFNPNKLTFQVDEVTGEIIQPQVLLCDRQLNKLGEIYPVNSLRIKANLNGADEVSFSTPRQSAIYDDIKDYSIVFVRGFGYFEVSPTVSDTFVETKNVQGSSLGETELSQLLCTLECNTDEDMESFLKTNPDKDYIPSVLYDASDPEHSLIHRILASFAPNYEVGTVDATIRNIQRTFSFSKTDVISCFNQIAEEIGCIFDVVVERKENGGVHRIVNIYDAQYCGKCNQRNIINGICQDCGSTDIRGIGDDTTIQIGTDNLSDEITLSSDGNMKNCFIVEGGDDLMTNTINGINPSGNNKIYKFSEETMNSFSPELKEKYMNYVGKYNEKKDEYAKIFEIQSSISDLILYLQSSRMPSVETAEKNLKEEVRHIIESFQNSFPNGLGIKDGTDISSKNSMIRQVISLFLDSGYVFRQEEGEYHPDKKCWTGTLILYEIQNNDSRATITVGENGSTITYSDSGETMIDRFRIPFKEENWDAFVKQEIAVTTDLYKNIQKLDQNEAKDWQKYSLNRLVSYKDGYLSCRLALEEIKTKSSLEGIESAANQMIEDYNTQIAKISEYISYLEDMIYYLHFYHGIVNADEKTHLFSSCETAFQNMVHYIKYGTWVGGEESEITDEPLYCSSCGSTSVTLNGCNICHGKVTTYSDIAEEVRKHYMLASLNGSVTPPNLQTQRTTICNYLNLRTNLLTVLTDDKLDDTCYKELCSYIREDVYTNSNFISAGMETNNTKLVSHAKELLQKAQLELDKACVPQHTLSGNVYAFVAYRSLNPEDFPIQNAYDNFKLGNYLRYISDGGKVYKLRLSSEEFSWDDSGASLNVEFTDVIQYANGTISDIESLIQHVGSLSTSFDSVKKQAEQGEKAGRTFTDIKNDGLYSALGNVLNARNQDVQITEEGISLRKFDYELDDYDGYQMKLINRNIVMTADGWKNASMAIGLGRYDGKLKYGVWADLLVGDMIVGEELVIKNDKENSTVLINKDGIKVGSINEKTTGVCVEINPNKDNVLNIFKRGGNGNTSNILWVNKDGNSKFEGEVNATGIFGGKINAKEGKIGNWEIRPNYMEYNEGDARRIYDITGYPIGMNMSDEGLHASLNSIGVTFMSNQYTSSSARQKIYSQIGIGDIMFRKYIGDNAFHYDLSQNIFSQFYVGSGYQTDDNHIYMTVSYPNGNNFTVNQNEVTISGLNTEIKAESIILEACDNTPLSNKTIELSGDNVYIHGRILYENGSYLSEIKMNSDYTSINGRTIYIGDSIENNQQKIILSGSTYIATDSEVSNCYIGAKHYNYGVVESCNDVILSNEILIPSNKYSLQKLGRIVVFSAVLSLKKGTNQQIGRIPAGYRPSHRVAISADNFSVNAECEIDEFGTIWFSCSGEDGTDYRIHGVWFWDADEEYTEETVG